MKEIVATWTEVQHYTQTILVSDDFDLTELAAIEDALVNERDAEDFEPDSMTVIVHPPVLLRESVDAPDDFVVVPDEV